MSNNDINNLMNQFNDMMKKNEFPDEIKNILNNFKNSSNTENNQNLGNTSNLNNAHNKSNNKASNNTSIPDIDMATLLKMKQVIDSMNSGKDDPRTNLLLSLKPYLKKSRQDKVEQYIKLFGLGKAFETLNSLGGDKKNDV